MKPPVLQNQRDVVPAVGPRQREHVRDEVLDDEHARETLVHLVASSGWIENHPLAQRGVRVRVVPGRLGAVEHRKRGHPSLSGLDRLVRTAVHDRRHVHPVPVGAGGDADVVRHVEGHVTPDLTTNVGPR